MHNCSIYPMEYTDHMADNLFSSGTTITPDSGTSLFSPFSFFSGSDPLSIVYNNAINWLFSAVGAALIAYLIWAGIKYITAGGDPKKAGDAKSSVINAAIGILIFISIYTLLSIGIGLGNAGRSIETGQITIPPATKK